MTLTLRITSSQQHLLAFLIGGLLGASPDADPVIHAKARALLDAAKSGAGGEPIAIELDSHKGVNITHLGPRFPAVPVAGTCN